MRKFMLFFAFAVLHVIVFSQDKTELEKKRKQTLQEIDALNNQYNEVKKNRKESIGQLTLIQNKIRLRNEVISTINKQVRSIDGDINTSYIQMRRLQKDLDTLKMNYAQNVVYAYKNRSSYDFLNFLFSATSFNDAVQRISYMKAYRNYRAQQLDAIVKTETLYKEKIAQLSNNKNQKSVVLKDQNKEMGELVKDKQEQDVVVNNLKKKEKEINKSIAAKRKQAQSLQASISAVIKREIKEAELAAKKEAADIAKKEKELSDKIAKENAKNNSAAANNPSTTTKTTVTTPKTTPTVKKDVSYLEYNKEDLALGNSFESSKGRLLFPVDNGYVSIPYGSYTIPGTTIKGYQEFITISSAIGTNVKAVFDGEVASVADVNGATTIALKHGKYFTFYSNLSSVTVKKGQLVKAGQSLGKVDSDIDGEGSFEFIITRETTNLNPSGWLRRSN